MEREIDTGRIVRETFALLRANRSAALIALVGLAASTTLIDMLGPEAASLNLAIGIAAIFAQYGVTRNALERTGLLTAKGQPGRAGAFVLALILTGLGTAIGFSLLVLPGIYLWARWSMVSPLIIGEGMSCTEAMRESWARSRPLLLPISAVLLLLSLPMLFTVGTAFLYPDYETPPLGAALLTNLLVYAVQTVGWHNAVALYGLTRDPSDSLEQVFA